MPAAIFPATFAVPRPANSELSKLSSISFLSGHHPFLSSTIAGDACRLPSLPSFLIIRMGGGPRTYPGGVTRLQWKRMQAKKAKLLLRARRLRERQIEEASRRDELKAAAQLGQPWQLVERARGATDLFYGVGAADEQAQRGTYVPEVFMATPEGLPSARFFPRGAVHSVKPYAVVDLRELEVANEGEEQVFDEMTSRQGDSLDPKVETFDETDEFSDAYSRVSNDVHRRRSKAEDNFVHFEDSGSNRNGRREELRSSFSSNKGINEAMPNSNAAGLDRRNGSKMMENGRKKMGNRRSETIELYPKKGIYQERGFMSDGNNGFK